MHVQKRILVTSNWKFLLHAIHAVLEIQFLFQLFDIIFRWQSFRLRGDWNEEASRSLRNTWRHSIPSGLRVRAIPALRNVQTRFSGEAADINEHRTCAIWLDCILTISVNWSIAARRRLHRMN
jgi:hypothetical protein